MRQLRDDDHDHEVDLYLKAYFRSGIRDSNVKLGGFQVGDTGEKLIYLRGVIFVQILIALAVTRKTKKRSSKSDNY